MTTPVDPREALARVVGRVLFHNTNYPDAVAPHVLGRDMTPLNDAITDALMAASYRPAHEVEPRRFTRAEVEQMVEDNTDRQGNLYRLDFLSTLEHEAELSVPPVTETPEEPKDAGSARFMEIARENPVDPELIERIKQGRALGLGHEFIGVQGHPDDDECTFRNDGTDLTYCGEPQTAHYKETPEEPTNE